jgi:hypothetical protein
MLHFVKCLKDSIRRIIGRCQARSGVFAIDAVSESEQQPNHMKAEEVSELFGYMAPEQMQGKDVPASDQLGCFASLMEGLVARSRYVRRMKASFVEWPHISSEGCKRLHTSGRSGLPKSAQR